MHKKAIIKSAIILTSANIITRVLGFFYRIYMSKTIGAEGMGLYQIITPLYLLIWAISSSGLSTTMSKLTAKSKRTTGKRRKNIDYFLNYFRHYCFMFKY